MTIRGDRDSSWLVVRRALAIVRRLLRGPATKYELLHAVRADVGPGAYNDAPPAAELALKRDRAALEAASGDRGRVLTAARGFTALRRWAARPGSTCPTTPTITWATHLTRCGSGSRSTVTRWTARRGTWSLWGRMTRATLQRIALKSFTR